jgi:hypothetical protein
MYELNAPINVARMRAIATGHSQTLERWEDGPNGRRSSGQPLIDEATGAPVRIYDCLFDTGRDGRPELHGVRIVSHEAPELAPYTEVTFDDLAARVRPARNGAKGIEVSFLRHRHPPRRRRDDRLDAAGAQGERRRNGGRLMAAPARPRARVQVRTAALLDELVLTCRAASCVEQWTPAPIGDDSGDGVVQLSLERCPACGSSVWEVTQVQVAPSRVRRQRARTHRSSRS